MGDGKRICFLGLGPIGGPIARRLAAVGHELIVYDGSDERAEAWIAADDSGAIRVPTPASGADGADAVIACLDRDEDVEAVFFGVDGATTAMRDDALLIDHTASSADFACRLAKEAAAQDLHHVDAPAGCYGAEAEKSMLAISCGGSEKAFALARPIMEVYAARIVHVGPAGTGQSAKSANQDEV